MNSLNLLCQSIPIKFVSLNSVATSEKIFDIFHIKFHLKFGSFMDEVSTIFTNLGLAGKPKIGKK